MRPEPNQSFVSPKPGRGQQRGVRSTVNYRQVRRLLGTSHAETMLLLRVGDLQSVTAGEPISGAPWLRTHLIIGLSAGVAVNTGTTSMGPWMIQDLPNRYNARISYSGLVLFIDRRHWHLVWSSTFGRVEQIAPAVGAGTVRRSRRSVPVKRGQQSVSATNGQ